jgi:hypothetical protein
MSLLARLAPHLPYMRRYARALTGSQGTGDHYVRVALEALAAGSQTLDSRLSPRVASIMCSTPSGAPPAPGSRTARPSTPAAIPVNG